MFLEEKRLNYMPIAHFALKESPRSWLVPPPKNNKEKSPKSIVPGTLCTLLFKCWQRMHKLPREGLFFNLLKIDYHLEIWFWWSRLCKPVLCFSLPGKRMFSGNEFTCSPKYVLVMMIEILKCFCYFYVCTTLSV